MQTWFALATDPVTMKRSIKVALLVGTILAAINHGDAILAGDLDLTRLLKICLTYVVPFAVSTYASVSAFIK
jgi:hypothetical protein